MAGGGAERACLNLANGWTEQGRHIGLILLRAEGAYLEQLNRAVPVIDLKARGSLAAAPRLWRLLSGYPGVPVITFELALAVVAQAGADLGRHRARVIYREPSHPLMNTPQALLPLYPLFVNRMDGVLAQNGVARAALRSLGVVAPRLVVAPNPTRLAVHAGPPADVSAPDGPLRIVAAGRLESIKGFDRLIRGVALLQKSRPEARLDIFGEGPLREALQRQIEQSGLRDSVMLRGFVGNLGAELRHADLFVLSSVYEGMPNVLLEAIASGVRVLSTPAGGGAAELLQSFGLKDCVMPDVEWETRFPEAIRTALAVSPERLRRCRDIFLSDFDYPRLLNQYARVLAKPDDLRI